MEQEYNELAEDRKDLEEFLQLQPTKVREDCKIVSHVDVGQAFMLRIDKKPPEAFIPNMPKSAMPSENTNTPRITCAPTLVGCMVGYFRIEDDARDGSLPLPNGTAKFLGGYSISVLPFKHCLKPGKEMVVDTDTSDEHWLVPYSMDSVEVEPDVVGKMFIDELTYLPQTGKRPSERLVMLLCIDKDIEIQLMPGKRVGKGTYRFTIFWPSIRERSVQDQNSLVSIEPISLEEFLKLKKAKADLLSYKDRLPGFSAWK